MKKILIITILLLGLVGTAHAGFLGDVLDLFSFKTTEVEEPQVGATVCYPYQGCTGISTIASSTILIGHDSNPMVTSTWTIPMEDGSANQILKTDGSGALTWQADADTGGAGASAWEYDSAADAMVPTSTKGIMITASSSIGADFRIDGNTTTTGSFYIGGTASTTELFVQDDGHIGGALTVDGSITGAGDITGVTIYGDGSNLTDIGAAAASALTISGKATETITKGQAVYVSGAVGTNVQFALADNTIWGMGDVIGLAAESKTSGQTMLVRVAGQLDNFDTSAWADGDNLYLSTGGSMVTTTPATGALKHIGDVEYAHASLGDVLIHIRHTKHRATAADKDLFVRMGDDAGANKNSYRNYSNTEVGYINSLGNIDFNRATTTYATSTILHISDSLTVAGSVSANNYNAGINVETLTGDKTLTVGTDEMYQHLNSNNGNRTITLATSTATAGDIFIIKNTDTYNSDNYLRVYQGAVLKEDIYSQCIKTFVFNGTDWVGNDIGVVDTNNIQIGYKSRAYDQGVAIGANTAAFASGVAIGISASGYNDGMAFGRLANAKNYGVAVGTGSTGWDYGVAIGYKSRGPRQGISIGYQAGYNIDTSADRRNILIGYQAGDLITTGVDNIILGYNADPPTATTNNHLNIGGIIFGDLSGGNVGIGTTTPSHKLSVAGSVLADQYIEYSPKYIGDAVSAIKNIKHEQGTEKGDWAKIDHATLPAGVRVETSAISTSQVGVEIIKYEAEYEDVWDGQATTTVLVNEARTKEVPIIEETSYTFVGRDLGASVQLNTRAIQQLIKRIEELEVEKKILVGGDLEARIAELEQNQSAVLKFIEWFRSLFK